MKSYPKNSPEAMARVVAMTMIADAALDDRELALMDRLRFYDIIGLDREGFADVVEQYCEDLLQTDGAGTDGERVALLAPERVDAVLDGIDDPGRQRLTAQMIASVAGADGRMHLTELALFGHVLARWNLSLEDLTAPAGG